jgi:hypothetical protein
MPKLKKGCLISGHDFHHHDMKDAFDIMNIKSFNVIFSDLQYSENHVYRHTSWWFIKK